MEQVGKVERLVFYPMKSMAAIEVSELECTHSGVRHQGIGDRHWVITTANGKSIDGRMQPRLCLLRPSFHGDMLHVDADDMETLKIPRDISAEGNEIKTVRMSCFHDALGVDCGEEASQWLSKFLGKEGLRLVYAAPGVKRRSMKDSPHLAAIGEKEDAIVYQDVCPGMLMAEASVQELNSRLKKPVKIDQFRANIIASDTAGPFVEDEWKKIRIGDSDWMVVSRAPRCMYPSVDLETGKRDPDGEPLTTLEKYRMMPELLPDGLRLFDTMPCIGVWLVVQKSGTIRVGDPIMAVKE